MFAQWAETLYDQGYRRLLPLLPGEKRPQFSGWQSYNQRDMRPDELERWVRVCPNHGIGLVAGGNVAALDMDHKDWQTAKAVQDLADQIIGETPLQRVGQAPKSLRLYRCKPGLVTKTYQRLQMGVYATTGQVVLYGIHPRTGRPYEWPEASPLDVHAGDLPSLELEKLNNFISEVEKTGLVKAPIKPRKTAKARPDQGQGPMAYYYRLRQERPDISLEDALSDYMRRASARHPAMVSCVAVLQNAGLQESNILDVIGDAYMQHFVGDGAREIQMRYRKLIDAIRGGERKGFALDLNVLRRKAGHHRWGKRYG